MSVIFVSHKLEEVDDLCDRVTVMRHGKVVGPAEMPMPERRAGRDDVRRSGFRRGPRPVELGDPLLTVKGLTVNERLLSIAELSVEVRSGEVLGLAGLGGSGQHTFMRAVAGLVSPPVGEITLDGTRIDGNRTVISLGLASSICPPGVSKRASCKVSASRSTSFWQTPERRSSLTGTPSPTTPPKPSGTTSSKAAPTARQRSCPGGNMHRLLLAMLRPGLRLLMMEHPTRGLDIESANWVWSQLLRRRTTVPPSSLLPSTSMSCCATATAFWSFSQERSSWESCRRDRC